MFPHTRLLRVLGHVSRDGQWGWDGACLEWPSDSSDDPKGYKAGDANLYRYCGNRPVIHVDPSGCGFWGSVGDFCYDYGRYLMHPSQMDPDLQVGNGIGYGMIGIGTGGLAGIGAGVAVGAGVAAVGGGSTVAGIAGGVTGSTVGGAVGAAVGGSGGGELGRGIGGFGGALGGGMGGASAAGAKAAAANAAKRAAAKEFFCNPLRQPEPFTPPYNPRMPRITPLGPGTDGGATPGPSGYPPAPPSPN